jgi:hypothetical protein
MAGVDKGSTPAITGSPFTRTALHAKEGLMLALITAAISLATSVCTFLNTEVVIAQAKALADLQNSLNAEVAKGYDSDDAKIESLYKQIQVAIGTINNEVAIFQASKTGASTAAPPVTS